MTIDNRQESSETGGVGYATGKAWWAGACRTLSASRVMAPFRSRTGRHRLVGLFLLILAAFPALGWLTDQLWVVVLNLIPFAAASLLLAVATQGVLDKPLRSLDERQVQLRQNLFREPYATGACLGLAGGLIVALATTLDDAQMMGLLLLVTGFIFTLPSLVLAWGLPEDTDDDG